MIDCQIVLRFFALREVNNIKGSVRAMLDDCMERNLNISEPDAAAFGAQYLEVLALAHRIFGKRVFRIRRSKGKWELSVPLYDAIMIAVLRLWNERERLVADKAQIGERIEKLLDNPDAYKVVVGKPNTAQAIRDRLNIVTAAVKG
jgi:hypothetical protein